MSPAVEAFPFQLDDIKAWIIKHKDGTVVRYELRSAEESKSKSLIHVPSGPAWSKETWPRTGTSYSSYYCHHEPYPDKDLPVFEGGGLRLFIAEASGARKVWDKFDVAIDGGSVLSVPDKKEFNLQGDKGLCGGLEKFTVHPGDHSTDPPSDCKILQIKWYDRCAPPCYPEFWAELLKKLQALQAKQKTPLDVLTICQGGHGRSGSALAILIMLLTDYSSLDALTHVRALHCARAIESKDQHEYLDRIARFLNRKDDALEATKVTSFKERFLTMKSEFAAPYMERLSQGKGAKVEHREAGYL